MSRIDYYFSVLSPFTYLAGDRLEKIAARHGATVVYRPCDIMKVFAAVGAQPVGQRHPSRQQYRLQELRRIARRNAMAINLRPAHWPVDPTPSAHAIIAAQDAGGDAGGVARALMRACWVDDDDVSDAAVVAAALAQRGLDAALRDDAASLGKTYAANTDAALAAGVFGAPFYVIGEERFWGQDRLDYLDAHLGDLARGEA